MRVASLTLRRAVFWRRVCGLELGKGDAGISAGRYPHIDKWIATVRARPAYQRAVRAAGAQGEYELYTQTQ